MAILSEDVMREIRGMFEGLTGPVKLLVFTQDAECEMCETNRALMEEIASTSDRLSVKICDFVSDKETADAYQIDKIPATIVAGEKDHGIRFYGIPSGHEFLSLIEAIKMVSAGDSMLLESTREQLKSLGQPVHIQVFVTPNCPYCMAVVQTAHRMAMECDLITADMVEATEFPALAQQYDIFYVPKTVINETTEFIGEVSELDFLEHVMQAGGSLS
jgi:glutaredoxin-like protein